jgi:hypothetical protein
MRSNLLEHIGPETDVLQLIALAAFSLPLKML